MLKNKRIRLQPAFLRWAFMAWLILAAFSVITIPKETRAEAKNPAVGEQIKWQVLAAGGNRGQTGSFMIDGTLGQTAAGAVSTSGTNLNQGFWQNFGSGSCCITPGDANNNGAFNILDVSYVINFLYKMGPAPVCQSQADVNANGTINILDVSYMINALYKGGPACLCGTID
jgi:hypothetical protein